MPIIAKLAKKEIGYSIKGPNEDPSKHFTLFENLPKTKACIGTSIDVSGSQQTQGGRDLLRYIKYCIGTDVQSSMFPFGDDGVMTSFSTISDFCIAYNRIERFNTSTMTFSLNNFLEKTKELGINKVVIVGDGEFGSYCISKEVETKKFTEKLKNLDLSHIQSLVLVFSPHTTDCTMETLKGSVFNILGSSKNALDVNCIRLPKFASDSRETHIYDIYYKLRESIQIPKEHCLVGNLFTFHSKMTNINLTKVILEHIPHIIEPLQDYIKFMILNQPHLLTSEDNIYGRLHNVLKTIIKDPYINWISLEKSKADGEKLKALTELLNNSYKKNEEIEEIIDKIKDYVIGYGILPESQITKEQILNMMKDGSCIMVKNYITNSLKSERFLYRPRRKGEPLKDNIGMLIVRPRRKSDGPEYNDILRLALKTIFLQFGNYLLEGTRCYISALTFIVNEDSLNGDKKIPPIIRKSISDAVFGDREYSFKMLGFDSKSETLELADNLCSPPIMKLIATCVMNFPEQMFETIGKQERELKHVMSKFIRCQKIVKVYRSERIQGYTLNRQIKKKLGGINVGDIVFVSSYPNEPQINLPAVGVIRVMRKSKKRKRWLVNVEYLDRKLGIDDTRYDLELSKVCVVCPKGDDELIDLINTHLMRQQLEGMDGKYMGKFGENGEFMRMNAPRVDALRDINDKLVLDIIGEYQKQNGREKDLGYVLEDIEVPIPTEHMLSILECCFKLNKRLIEILRSGQKLNKKDVLECAEVVYKISEKDLDLKPFVYKGNDFIIESMNIQDIKKIFWKSLENNSATMAHVFSSKCCPICTEDKPIHEFTAFEECNHPICLECKSYYDGQIKYIPSSIVNLVFHRCCECNHFQKSTIPDEISTVLTKYGGELPSKLKLRYCENCNDLFETELHCGMTEDSIPRVCQECQECIDSTNSELYKICPLCDIVIEKTEGCDHMECVCGGHWCWGCRRIFSEEIIDLDILGGINWECSGPCHDNSEQKYLDNSEDYIGY